MKRKPDAPVGSLAQLPIEIPSTFKDEGVVAVAVEAVVAAEALVDQDRVIEPVGEVYGDIENRVLVAPHRVVEPEENELPIRNRSPPIERATTLGKVGR
ncbi:hypothetical protein ABWH91_06705 [Phycisphaerales bacterium ac7]